MLATAVALLLAHCLADFVCQTRAMVQAKHRPAVLAAHSAMVGLTAVAALGALSATVWFGVLLLSLAHAAIDRAKLVCAGPGGAERLAPFCVDQWAHLVTVAVFVLALPQAYDHGLWPALADETRTMLPAALMALMAGTIAVTRIGELLVALLLAEVRASAPVDHRDSAPAAPQDKYDTPQPNAGAWIGWLERGLVFLLVLVDQFAAIGFVIAAKSILRFEYARDPGQGEQVIIGTLASFGWAIGVGLATRATLSTFLPVGLAP